MIFNSLIFPFFLIIVLTAYWWISSHRKRQILLLVASYIFYGWWDYRFLGLIAFSSAVDYWCGKAMDRLSPSSLQRKKILAVSIVSNLMMLGFFKYFNFFIESITHAFAVFGVSVSSVALHIILPVGISFYTFQALSYTIDVYRKKIPACQDAITFFLYVSYFPQLVAGPIERSSDLLPQLATERIFNASLARHGLRLILWGFFLKSVLADNLAPIVDGIYGTISHHSGGEILFATYAFAFQIYADFAGYTSIARGVSLLFGVTLSENFRMPYVAQSVREFWVRWHISLTSWFREYVYIFWFGGNRVAPPRRVFNILATFTLSGLWHGASWNFVLWGMLNGLFYFVPAPFSGRKILASIVNTCVAFHLVLIGWIFFRAGTLSAALEVFTRLVTAFSPPSFFHMVTAHRGVVVMVFAVLMFELLRRYRYAEIPVDAFPRFLRFSAYAMLLGLLFFAGNFHRQPFIYFQF